MVSSAHWIEVLEHKQKQQKANWKKSETERKTNNAKIASAKWVHWMSRCAITMASHRAPPMSQVLTWHLSAVAVIVDTGPILITLASLSVWNHQRRTVAIGRTAATSPRESFVELNCHCNTNHSHCPLLTAKRTKKRRRERDELFHLISFSYELFVLFFAITILWLRVIQLRAFAILFHFFFFFFFFFCLILSSFKRFLLTDLDCSHSRNHWKTNT